MLRKLKYSASVLLLVSWSVIAQADGDLCSRYLAAMQGLSNELPLPAEFAKPVTGRAEIDAFLHEQFEQVDAPGPATMRAHTADWSRGQGVIAIAHVYNLLAMSNPEQLAHLNRTRDWLAGASTVVEFGSGQGGPTSFLAMERPNQKVIAVDIRPQMKQMLDFRLNLLPGDKAQVEFVNKSFFELGDSNFDGAYIGMTLFHLGSEDAAKLLRSIKDSLPVGGRVSLFEPIPTFHGSNPRDTMANSPLTFSQYDLMIYGANHNGVFSQLVPPEYSGPAIGPLPPPTLINYLERIGFEVHSSEVGEDFHSLLVEKK